MKLNELLRAIEYTGSPENVDVKDIVIDSRKVGEGSLFVAVKGGKFDGHDVVEQVLGQGAAAVVTERPTGAKSEIVVKNTRKANALLSAAFFGNPEKKLKLVGVTGTNGKTTVASIVKQALAHLGKEAGLIGTIQCEIGDNSIPAKFTTPEPFDLSALFANMAAAGCEYVVMEASSQALAQHRLYGQHFETAVFTNLSQDHLDYHKTMDAYFDAKKMLFDMADTAVINIDDPYGKKLFDDISIPSVTCSDSSNEADFTAKSADYRLDRVKFAISGDGFIGRIRLPMPGHYSVMNALLAMSALVSLGFSPEESCEAVSKTKGVKGRSEILYKGQFTVITDFAHTADALRQLLSSLKPYVAGRMIVLFGCAGDRDAAKRPDMAEAVCDYADVVILTSDNPRTENPDSIIDGILPVFERRKVPYHKEIDREAAVRYGLAQCRAGDLLLLCGKGHEDYQVLDGVTVYLDERDIVNDYLSQRGKERQ